MSEHTHFRQLPHDDRRLAQRLRSEAARSRPEFSEALHARIVAAIEERAEKPAVSPIPNLQFRIPLLVALACVLVIGVAVWSIWGAARRPVPSTDNSLVVQAAESEDDSGDSFPGLAEGWQLAVDLAGHPAEQIDSALAAALTDRQWENLDHDFQAAIDSLKDQFPFDIAFAVASAQGADETQP